KDVGFVAANWLAGGRRGVQLVDTAADVSLLKGMIIDVRHSTNRAEKGGLGDDSTGVHCSGSNATVHIRMEHNHQCGSTTREQRNSFRNLGILDSYNIDSYDFARGANSILFGNGSIGGNVNTVTKQALLSNPLIELQARYGSNNLRRFAVDLNQPLVKDK